MINDNQQVFAPDQIFSYNLKKKRFFAITSIVLVLLLIFLVSYYLLFLKNSDKLFVFIINSFFAHVTSQVGSSTLLGIFYSSLFGGLFFVVMPVEAVFIAFLRAGCNAFLIMLLYMAGMLVSYTINYFIGMKLAEISKKLITPQKFYKIKKTLNKFGAPAIFVFNVLPLPSQPLAAILGVFKYNKTKFYFFFLSGQILKYLVITLGYIYIF